MKKKVCVITGGGSGMGLATAKKLGKEGYSIILAGRTEKKLKDACNELGKEGIEANSCTCDISDYYSVEKLAEKALQIGEISSVIHSAGMSPRMGNASSIMRVNAVGTINVNEVFYKLMKEGSCLIDVASMSGHMVPAFLVPKRVYKYSRIEKELFMKKMMKRVNLFPQKLRPGIAYSFSKHFVIWYARNDALKFGEKGIRVISISPGFFETPMGEIEKDGVQGYIESSAIKRFGRVEEIASLFAFCASDKASYLTGTDILCDGGCLASRAKVI